MKQIRKRTYFRLTKKKGGNQDSPGSNMFLYLPDVMIAKLTYLHSELFLAKPTDWPTECWPNKMEKKSIVDDCDFIPSSATMLLTVAKIINWWKSPSYTPLLSTEWSLRVFIWNHWKRQQWCDLSEWLPVNWMHLSRKALKNISVDKLCIRFHLSFHQPYRIATDIERTAK